MSESTQAGDKRNDGASRLPCQSIEDQARSYFRSLRDMRHARGTDPFKTARNLGIAIIETSAPEFTVESVLFEVEGDRFIAIRYGLGRERRAHAVALELANFWLSISSMRLSAVGSDTYERLCEIGATVLVEKRRSGNRARTTDVCSKTRANKRESSRV